VSQLHEYEVPSSLDDLPSSFLEYAAKIYCSCFGPVCQACDRLWQGSEIIASNALEFNEKALSYVAENLEASFVLAHRLIEAKDLEAALDIQTAFASQRTKSCVRYIREFSSLMVHSMQECF
jgi:hypothetical protein